MPHRRAGNEGFLASIAGAVIGALAGVVAIVAGFHGNSLVVWAFSGGPLLILLKATDVSDTAAYFGFMFLGSSALYGAYAFIIWWAERRILWCASLATFHAACGFLVLQMARQPR